MTEQPEYSADFRDMIAAMLPAGARFIVVGAHAMAAHGVLRATGDFDLFIEPEAPNAKRVMAALRDFGAPLDTHGIQEMSCSAPTMHVVPVTAYPSLRFSRLRCGVQAEFPS
jgi:hypothetical protein